MKGYIEVQFLKPCPGYSYFPGDYGCIKIKALTTLLKEGYIRIPYSKLIRKNINRIYSGILDKLKFLFKDKIHEKFHN